MPSNQKRQRQVVSNDSEVEIVDASIKASSATGGDVKTSVTGGSRTTRGRKPSAKAKQMAEVTETNSSVDASASNASKLLKALDDPFGFPSEVPSDDDLPPLTSISSSSKAVPVDSKDADSEVEIVESPRKITKSSVDIKSASNAKVYDPPLQKKSFDDTPTGKKAAPPTLSDLLASKMDVTLRAMEHDSDNGSDQGDIPSVDDDGDSIDEQGEPVTNKKFQHPELQELYQGLPYLKCLAQIISFKLGPDDDVPIGTIPMESLFRRVLMPDLTCIFDGLSFSRYNRFVNAARVDPKIFRTETISRGGKNKTVRIMLTDLDVHPILWMLGGIVGSFLVSTSTSFNKPVHGVKMGLFSQEARRDFSVWGRTLGFTEKMGSVDEEGYVSFLTRTDNSKPNEASSSSPTKSPRGFKTMYTPRAVGSQSRGTGGKDFPFERFFEDRVPVYNGIASEGHPFRFRKEDFDDLPSRPLWKGSKAREIPERSIVAVGYTLHVWGDQGQYLSTNIVSVIVLHAAE